MILKRELFKAIPKALLGILPAILASVPFILNYPSYIERVNQRISQGLGNSSVMDNASYHLQLGGQIVGPIGAYFLGLVVILITIGLISREASKGSIKLLLSMPTSRFNIYIQKALAALLGILFIDTLFMLFIVIGSAYIKEALTLKQALATSVILLSVHFFILGFSLFQSSLFNDTIKPIVISVILLVAIPNLVVGNSFANHFYFTTYMKTCEAVAYGKLHASNLAVLLGTGLLFLTTGFWVFKKRDF